MLDGLIGATRKFIIDTGQLTVGNCLTSLKSAIFGCMSVSDPIKML